MKLIKRLILIIFFLYFSKIFEALFVEDFDSYNNNRNNEFLYRIIKKFDKYLFY